MGIEAYYNMSNMLPEWYRMYNVSRTTYADGSFRYYYFKDNQYMFTEAGKEEFFPADFDYKKKTGPIIPVWEQNIQKKLRIETNEERSLRRSKRLLKDYVLNNHIDGKKAYFVTITNCMQSINLSDLYGGLSGVPAEVTQCFANSEIVKEDNAEFKKRVLKKMSHIKQKNPNFEYILVPEFHCSGYIHLHGFFFNCPDNLMEWSGLKHNGNKVYNIVNFQNIGHTQCTIVRKISKASSYVTKYVTKEMATYKGWQRYYISSGIKKPIIEKVEMTMDDFFKYCEWFKDCGNGFVGFCSPLPF